MAMLPTLPTDNLYKFLALFGLVLFVFGFYFPQEKFARAIDQGIDAQKAQKFAQIRIDRKKAQNKDALNHVEQTMNELKKNQKLLLDAEAALKTKRQSKALESEIKGLNEQVRQHNENVEKNGQEIQRGKAQAEEISDEMSIALVNAQADGDKLDQLAWEAKFWSAASIVCAIIGG
jgi:uncharacterized membrane protein YgaE (UPF0421/DUF939 family)